MYRNRSLRKLATVDDAALLVVACEELHELGDLLHDLKYTGTKAWERSPVHGMELGWYYREILALANRRLVSGPTAALVSELGARVRQLHGIVYEGNPY